MQINTALEELYCDIISWREQIDDSWNLNEAPYMDRVYLDVPCRPQFLVQLYFTHNYNVHNNIMVI